MGHLCVCVGSCDAQERIRHVHGEKERFSCKFGTRHKAQSVLRGEGTEQKPVGRVEAAGSSFRGRLPGKFALQVVHDLVALAVVANLGLDEGMQVAQMGGLGCADSLQQELRYFRLAVKFRLGHSQVTFGLRIVEKGQSVTE